jgi:hypothetical protein
MSNYKTEFPDYDLLLSLPAGWVDVSWHNDVSPSFVKQFGEVAYKLWCDYSDPDRREVGGEQFTVCVYIEDEVNFECIGQFDSLQEALDFVNKETTQ